MAAQEAPKSPAAQESPKQDTPVLDHKERRRIRPDDPPQTLDSTIAPQKIIRAADQAFVNGKLHFSPVMFGMGLQVGYRLTDDESISINYDFDGFTRDNANWFTGVAHQIFFSDKLFLQTGIGALTSIWYNDLNGKYNGIALNTIIGGEHQFPTSGVMIGADFIGIYLCPVEERKYICGGVMPKFRIGYLL